MFKYLLNQSFIPDFGSASIKKYTNIMNETTK